MKKDLVTTEIIVKENKVGILRVGNVNYISLWFETFGDVFDDGFLYKDLIKQVNDK